MKLGMFDPPEMVPYTKIDEHLLDSAEHRAMARKLANEAMVLLKNDGTLPLRTSNIKIAVVGPLADQTKVLLGNYNGTPTHTVSILEGLTAEFSGATIKYVPGTQFLGHDAGPVPASALTVDGKPGIKASYSKLDMANLNNPANSKPVAERVEATVDASAASLPAETASVKPLAIHWAGMLTAPETGDYNLGMASSGFFRMKLDGKDVTSSYTGNGKEAKLGRVHLEAGKPEKLEIDAAFGFGGAFGGSDDIVARLEWSKVNLAPSADAIAAAKSSDVVVAVVGITSELEGEEMQVSEAGFKGGDRTSIDLPKPEEDLLEAVAATGKPLIVVLTNGSALGVNWAKEHANAIIDAWYPGEEGGAAVAQTLSGRNNPAGRLPVTFYKDVSQLPAFEDYSMKGRTYRYFEGMPLYPFGYGLSYTTFGYSGLSGPEAPIAAGAPVSFDVTIENTGRKPGDEVAQLYLEFPNVPGAPLKALRGFQRVHLESGESKKIHFELQPRDLGMVSAEGVPMIAEGEYTVSVGGGQPRTGAKVVSRTFKIKGKMTLPE